MYHTFELLNKMRCVLWDLYTLDTRILSHKSYNQSYAGNCNILVLNIPDSTPSLAKDFFPPKHVGYL